MNAPTHTPTPFADRLYTYKSIVTGNCWIEVENHDHPLTRPADLTEAECDYIAAAVNQRPALVAALEKAAVSIEMAAINHEYVGRNSVDDQQGHKHTAAMLRVELTEIRTALVAARTLSP